MGRDQVRELVSQGLTNSQIAEKLGISRETVRYHKSDRRRQQTQARIANHRIKLKRKAIDYSGGECLKCGYNYCGSSLTFHHLDPNEKEFNCNGDCRSWDRMKAEIDKTILVCRNCHGEVHAGLWKVTKTMITKQQKLRATYEDRPLVDYDLG